MRTLRPATLLQSRQLATALRHLLEARKFIVAADCPATTRKVRSAIKSTEGAQRHMERRLMEASR